MFQTRMHKKVRFLISEIVWVDNCYDEEGGGWVETFIRVPFQPRGGCQKNLMREKILNRELDWHCHGKDGARFSFYSFGPSGFGSDFLKPYLPFSYFFKKCLYL